MSVKKLLLISGLIIVALAVPLTIYIVQKQQETRSHATASTTVSLTPSSITKNVDDTMDFNIELNPGNNLVFAVTIDIAYDPAKLAPANGTQSLSIPTSVFPQVSDVALTPGHILITASSPPGTTSFVISQPKTIGKVSMKAIAGTGSTPTKLEFGPKTDARSTSGGFTGSDDSASENVIASTVPALITILGDSTTVSPTIPPVDDTPIPTATLPPAATLTPTKPAATATQPPVNATNTPTVTPRQTATNPTATPSPTSGGLLAQGPTSTPTNTSGNVNSNNAFTTNTPTPTIDATGPGLTYVTVGVILGLLTLVGSILFFTL